jgi:hypothetical protein
MHSCSCCAASRLCGSLKDSKIQSVRVNSSIEPAWMADLRRDRSRASSGTASICWRISPEKVTHYLLVPHARGDKSEFLGRAGFTLEHAGELLDALRARLLPLEATPTKSNFFGQYYETRGQLTGPNGVVLPVRAIWMTERLSGVTKFVTLLPDKRKAR